MWKFRLKMQNRIYFQFNIYSRFHISKYKFKQNYVKDSKSYTFEVHLRILSCTGKGRPVYYQNQCENDLKVL